MAHHFLTEYAGVAELADALDLGSSVIDVGVRVPSPALFEKRGRGGTADALG